MGIRKLALLGALGLSMASAPVMAQTSAPLSLSPASAATVERGGAAMDEANFQGRGRALGREARGFPFLIVFVVIVVGLGVYFAFDDDEDSVSV